MKLSSLALTAAGALLLLFSNEIVSAQSPDADSWLGITLPPAFQAHRAPVILGTDYGPRPALVPAGEEAFRALLGETIRQDLETIVGFAKDSRENREVGGGQLWGRITGLPSADRTMDWVVERFEAGGVARVERQWFDQEEGTSLWLPLSWEVRLLADPVFGADSRDIVLESAMPAGGTELPPEGLTAPLVFVGTARPAELANIDVRGKVAVQHVTPKGHLFLERGPARAKAAELIRRGALAVFNIVDQSGNMRMRDISNCGGPCFNIGGQDGRFLEQVMDRAADAGTLDRLHVSMKLEAEQRSGLRASNVLGVVPGDSDENIIINAHADGWFDGANDNGDGLAIMLALSEHFSQSEHRPSRTLVFVASAGHHTSGLRGPTQLVALNPELIERNVLTINLEHVAARQLNPARTATDGVRDLITDAGEGFLMNGVSNRSPFLQSVIREGGDRYGLNFVSLATSYNAGDNPRVEAPVFQLIQGNPLYHTSGETLETISTPGLERVARFMAFFLNEVNEVPRRRFYPSG